LDLHNADFPAEDLSSLIRSLTNSWQLTSLSLEVPMIFTENHAKELALVLQNSSSCGLTNLSISRCQIGYAGCVALCTALKQNTRLRTLNLCNTGLPAKCGTIIAQLFSSDSSCSSSSSSRCALTSLNLAYNNLVDEGLKPLLETLFDNQLKRTPKLSYLYLIGNGTSWEFREQFKARCAKTPVDCQVVLFDSVTIGGGW
jgi:hypothetical protein